MAALDKRAPRSPQALARRARTEHVFIEEETMLNAPTLEQLHALKLAAMATAWTEQQAQADMTTLAFDERFALLVEAEWRARENKRLARTLHEAKLKLSHACLEAIDYPARRELDKAVIRQLTIHADRGPSMTSQPVALLLATLGVVPSHSRPHVSDDNPFSEAQFKTLKYRPDFPDRFGAYEDAETFCRRFFPWYNLKHRHGALGLMTPHDIHYGLAEAKWQQRAEVLRAAYAAHPERFPRGVPVPPPLPTAAWINKPPASPALAGPEGAGS